MENTYVRFVSIGVGVAIGIDAWEEYSIPIPTPIPINTNNSNFHESGILKLQNGMEQVGQRLVED